MSDKKIQWETLDLNNFRVFLRDLSSSTDINLKHMIEDSFSEEKRLRESSSVKQKKTTMKKKDRIIQENNRRLHQRDVEKDRETMKFLIRTINDDDPYLGFETLRTEEAKTEYKMCLLERYWKKKKKYLKHVLVLYFHLQASKGENPELFAKIEKVLDNYEVKGFMLEKMGDLLPPLNFWDKGTLKLDPWQREVIGYVKQRDSVIVKAPTSAGKTFIAMATGILVLTI